MYNLRYIAAEAVELLGKLPSRWVAVAYGKREREGWGSGEAGAGQTHRRECWVDSTNVFAQHWPPTCLTFSLPGKWQRLTCWEANIVAPPDLTSCSCTPMYLQEGDIQEKKTGEIMIAWAAHQNSIWGAQGCTVLQRKKASTTRSFRPMLCQ